MQHYDEGIIDSRKALRSFKKVLEGVLLVSTTFKDVARKPAHTRKMLFWRLLGVAWGLPKVNENGLEGYV